jgi:hypothetical protein
MFVDLFSYLVACSSSCGDLRLTLRFSNYLWVFVYFVLPRSLFCRGNSVKILTFIHVWGIKCKMVSTYVGGVSLYLLSFDRIHSILFS